MAAFSGYCAARGVAQWYTEGLPPFTEFYPKPRPEDKPQEYTSEEYIARYKSWT